MPELATTSGPWWVIIVTTICGVLAYGANKLCDAMSRAWDRWLERQAAKDAEMMKDRDADRQAAKDSADKLMTMLKDDRDLARTATTDSEIRHVEMVTQAIKTLTEELKEHSNKSQSVYIQNTEIAGGQRAIIEAINKNTEMLGAIGLGLQAHMKRVEDAVAQRDGTRT